ncbi:transaldolase family protein [Shouchella shacheensis]|uniref:transaldolase family protein n=1 Tax=Shouchella shacheensis TaxID=1649580 RepID=UPI00073FD94B|nr:transaldolase family protein [Shouchella shacheensis]
MSFSLLLDSADVQAFQSLSEWFPLDGITTNPTILAKNDRVQAEDQVKKLDQLLQPEQTLHIQVVSKDADGMIAEGHRIQAAFDREIAIKIPVSKEGFKAIKTLASEKVSVTATGVFTVQQAFLAGKAGATHVAPYVNRIDAAHGNSREVLKRIVTLFNHYGMSTRVLAASFKNVRQVEEALLAGVHEATVAPDILETLIVHQGTTDSIEEFTNHFEGAFGVGSELYLKGSK